jgi:hypothetical protein
MQKLGTYRRLHDLQFIDIEAPRAAGAGNGDLLMALRSMTGFAQLRVTSKNLHSVCQSNLSITVSWTALSAAANDG